MLFSFTITSINRELEISLDYLNVGDCSNSRLGRNNKNESFKLGNTTVELLAKEMEGNSHSIATGLPRRFNYMS
jgi:hypothetical protein